MELEQILIDFKISLRAQNIALSSSLEYLRLKKKFYRSVKKKGVKTSLEVIKLPSAENKSKISLDKLKYQLLELKSRLSWEGIRVGLSPKYSRLKTEFYSLGKTLGLKASLKPSSSDGFYFPNPSKAEIKKIKNQSYLRSYRDLSDQLNGLKNLLKTKKACLNSSLEYLRLKKAFYRVGQKVGLRASLNTHKLPAKETILGRASHFTKSLSTSELIKYAEDFDNEAVMNSVTDFYEPSVEEDRVSKGMLERYSECPNLSKYAKDFINREKEKLALTPLQELASTPLQEFLEEYLGPDVYESLDRISRSSSSCKEDYQEELFRRIKDLLGEDTFDSIYNFFSDIPALENNQSSQEILPEESESYPDLKVFKWESSEERLICFREALKEHLGSSCYEAFDCEQYSEEELYRHVKDCLGENTFDYIYTNFSGLDPVILPGGHKSYPALTYDNSDTFPEVKTYSPLPERPLSRFEIIITRIRNDYVASRSNGCLDGYKVDFKSVERKKVRELAFNHFYNCELRDFTDENLLESEIFNDCTIEGLNKSSSAYAFFSECYETKAKELEAASLAYSNHKRSIKKKRLLEEAKESFRVMTIKFEELARAEGILFMQLQQAGRELILLHPVKEDFSHLLDGI